jgi:hypothetical protein
MTPAQGIAKYGAYGYEALLRDQARAEVAKPPRKEKVPRRKKVLPRHQKKQKIKPDGTRPALFCMRCGKETAADELDRLYGNYWLCVGCADLHRALWSYTERVQRYRNHENSTQPISKAVVRCQSWDAIPCGTEAAG